MRLTSLSLQGFKSFADRVQFDFSAGVSGIVGPNGSGKSNVIDALRWVTGGGRATAYRADEKTELIFHGATGKRSVNFAEVELQLQGERGNLRIARSLYRDGQGRLSLNGKSARLSEVDAALSGSGLGRGGLAVIGQGEVGQVLVADPARLLAYVEEATGVARLSGRREDTVSRLQGAKDHLGRLDELLLELSERAGKLQREAEEAEEAEVLNRRSLQVRYTLAWRRQRTLEEDTGTLEREAASLRAALERGEEALQVQQARWQAFRQELSLQEAAYRQATTEAEARRGDVRVATERHTSLLARQQGLARERTRLETDLAEIGDRPAPTPPDVAINDLERQHEVTREAQAARETRLHTASTRLQQAQEAREAARERQRQHEQALLAYETERAQLEERAGDISARLEALLVQDNESALEILENALSTAKSKADTAQARVSELTEALERAQRAQATAFAHHQAAKRSASRARAAFEARRGYAEGPRHALQSGIPGILGPVADLITVPQALHVAVSTALGRRAENIVVDSADTGQRVLEHLRKKGGRATVLPLDLIEGRSEDDQALAGEVGYRGLLSRLISYEARFGPLVRQLLGGTGLVETLEQGVSIARRQRRRPRLVTLEGDLIEAYGALTGGKAQAGTGGIIGARAEVEALEAEVALAEQALAEGNAQTEALQERYRRAAEAQRASQEALQRVSRELAEAREQQAGHAALARELTAQQHLARERLAALTAPAPNEDDDPSTLEAAVQALEAERAQEASALAAARSRLAEAQEALAVGRERWRRFEDASAEAKRAEAQRASLLARQAQLTEELGTLEAALVEASTALETATMRVPTDLGAKGQAHEDAKRQATALENALAEASRAQAERSAKLEASRLSLARREASLELAREEVKAFPAGVAIAEGSLKALRDELSEVQAQLAQLGPVNHRAKLELHELKARLEDLSAQSREAKEAVGELEGILGSIDSEVNSRLTAAIQQARQKFILHARQLFGGGEADILTERAEGRPVGLKISLQPPGKQTRSLNLLSVGERTMGALAFLFALMASGGEEGLSVAVLDEVDAPLDEANIRRFCGFLISLAKDGTQFVLITHQKATMEVADTLWGVTTEQGVSRVFSISRSDREAAV